MKILLHPLLSGLAVALVLLGVVVGGFMLSPHVQRTCGFKAGAHLGQGKPPTTSQELDLLLEDLRTHTWLKDAPEPFRDGFADGVRSVIVPAAVHSVAPPPEAPSPIPSIPQHTRPIAPRPPVQGPCPAPLPGPPPAPIPGERTGS